MEGNGGLRRETGNGDLTGGRSEWFTEIAARIFRALTIDRNCICTVHG